MRVIFTQSASQTRRTQEVERCSDDRSLINTVRVDATYGGNGPFKKNVRHRLKWVGDRTKWLYYGLTPTRFTSSVILLVREAVTTACVMQGADGGIDGRTYLFRHHTAADSNVGVECDGWLNWHSHLRAEKEREVWRRRNCQTRSFAGPSQASYGT